MTKKTIIRVVKKPGEFALIHKAYLSDDRLGLDGMGLLTWLLTKPDDWKAHIGHIAEVTGTAYGRVRACMSRLDECGYVRRSPVRDRRSGRILRWETTVFETPAAAQAAEEEQPLLFERVERVKNGRKPGQKEEKPRFQRNTPFAENPQGGSPENGYPLAGNPFDGKPHLLRTNETKNDLTKQRRTNPPAADGCGESDRLPAGAGGSAARVATTEPPESASAEEGRGTVVVESEEQIVALLVERAYFPRPEAAHLVRQYGAESCARGLRVLQATSKRPANVRGFVVDAIRHGWEPNNGSAPPKRPATAPLAAQPAEKPAVDRAIEREQQAVDAALQRVCDDEWAAHIEAIRPTLGESIQKMLAAGRDPRGIRTIRNLVYERVRRARAA